MMAISKLDTGVFLCIFILFSNLVEIVSAGDNGINVGGGGGRSLSAGPVRSVGGPQATIFNVLRYGASPNGKKDSTEAWVAACHWRGNARLLIPAGTFLIGPVIFAGPCNSKPIVVQIKGTVKAITDVSLYDSATWVLFETISGLIVMGDGTFDGQGASVWKYNDCHQNSNCQMLPVSLKFQSVTNANIYAINSINSMSFHMGINQCENFKAHNMKITAPADSPNTDGIHISNSNRVRISRTIIGSGDDCISIGEGVTNTSISRIDCGPGHGISIGSLGKYPNEKDVRGIIVRNSTLTGTTNGIRIKTWPGSPPSKASGFIFQDITMTNVLRPIIIDQEYCPRANCKIVPSRVSISDIHIKNIHGTSMSPVGVRITCSSANPCRNVFLTNINLQYVGDKQGEAPFTSTCSNVKVRYLGVQNPPPC